jgi:flagellar motor component MotA
MEFLLKLIIQIIVKLIDMKDFIPVIVAMLTSLIAVIVATITAIIALRNTNLMAKIALRNTDLSLRISRQNELIDSISELLSEIHKSTWLDLKQNKYVSERHSILENKIRVLLDRSVLEEENLLTTIKKFKEQEITAINVEQIKENTLDLLNKIVVKQESFIIYKIGGKEFKQLERKKDDN